MKFPSIALLAERAVAVVRRFPWTVAAGVIAAALAIAATYPPNSDEAVRGAMAALLALPATIALTLTAERRGWSPALHHGLQALVAIALAGFWLAWPGPDEKHHAIRYLQLSAALHLTVAFLPWLGAPEGRGFWQYNRRLFLGFLRAGVFSAVLFLGTAMALAAVDALFGVDVDEETYVRIWFVAAFVVNTLIFLAAVPGDLASLDQDTEYPRALEVFAQYILTPLAFSYLLILLAYLVKLVAGGEWPSGWIGWLVTSVAVTGILGFLLVHPLRDDAGEGWIRTYTRWLFIGLVPASVMLLVAFWKRIVPYGMTEPRVLGIVLGVWLLGISIGYALRPRAGIRRIPLSLALGLLVILYGPLSPTAISVASQRDRLAELLPAARDSTAAALEASGALRFLIEHRAGEAIAAAIGREVPPGLWDSLDQNQLWPDSVGTRIMALAGAPYLPHRYGARLDGMIHLYAPGSEPRTVAGFDWIVELAGNSAVLAAPGGDTLRSSLDSLTGVLSVRGRSDTFRFELSPLLRLAPYSLRGTVPAESLLVDATDDSGRARLALTALGGEIAGDTVRVRNWSGWLMVRR